MKKSIIYSVFLSLMLMLCGVLYGCGGRYDNLSMSAYFWYDTSYATDIDNGVVRYQKDNVVFDDNRDGSYTFYIKPLSNITVPLQVEFKGMPDDFNVNASTTFTNELIVTPSEQVRLTNNGCVRNITFHSAGETTVNVISDEGGKNFSIDVKVVEIPSSISFVNNNHALTKTEGSFVDLSRDKALKVVPGDSSVLKVNYNFGKIENDVFVAYTDLELWGYGLSFDKLTNKLSVKTASDLTLSDFWIEADYENPLGENLKAYTQVKVVNEIEKESFGVYLGTSRLDAKEENLVNDIQNLIHNITGLNYVDVVLKIKSNGEKVAFGVVDDGLLPVDELVFEQSKTEYVDKDGNIVVVNELNPDNYKKAVYTFISVKVVAAKKTVENIKYNQDGIYNLKFTCDYADYTVQGYPVIEGIDVKIYDLIKQFSVNKQAVEKGSIIEDKNFDGYYQDLIYINTAESVDGTKLNIDVSSPVSILKEFSKYTLSLYYFDESKSEGEQFVKIDDVPSYFRIQKTTSDNSDKTNTSSGLTETFDKETTFYIKVNENTNNVKIDQTYYLIVEAVLPNNEIFAGKDVEAQRAKATIKLDVVQGITEIENYSYYVKNYQVDELTGKHTRIDPDTQEKLLYDSKEDKYYKLTDPTADDTIENRTYLEGELVVESKKEENIKFSDDYIGDKVIYIDLTSGFNANVILKYLPVGANLQNLIIKSSDESVLQISTYVGEDDIELFDRNAFSIVAKSVGEANVLISTSNLDHVYKIAVSVYKPITNMFVALTSTSWDNGVGQHTTVVDANTQNKIVESAVVMVGKSITLSISTLPFATSGYTMQYSLYEYKNDAFDMDNVISSYTKYYDGTASSALAYIQNDLFIYNCKTNVFVFSENASINDKVLLHIKLINLDGSYIERFIALSSFVPVVSLDTTPARETTLTNPNTIAYELKTNDLSDKSVFALKAVTNKNKTNSTFDFYNYGYIRVLYNGITEIFEVKNGRLVYDSNNKILLPISDQHDAEGNYLFKLNPDYNYSKSYNTIVLTVQIKEFNNYFSKLIYVFMRYNTMVSSLITQDETDMYFKQGLTDNKTFNFEVENEKADNKTVLAKTFNVLIKNDNIYYVEASAETTNVISQVELNQTSSGVYNFEVKAENAGEAVVVLMPQDKIITKAQYDTWNNFSYQSININSGEFVTNFYYIYEDGKPVLATDYDADAKYFIKCVQVSSYVAIWKDYLAVYVTVADGEKVPYQVASLGDLQEISKTNDSVTKRYVLVKNLILDTTHNWTPIANYYVENLTAETYRQGKYYTLSNGVYSICEDVEFNSEKVFYSYGFNGEFNFRYSRVDIKQNIVVKNSFSILNIAYAGSLDGNHRSYGMFSELGNKAKVLWADISYNFYQPKIEFDFVFGGLVGINHGLVIGAHVEYNNTIIDTYTNASVGGVVGINYGIVNNNNYYSVDVDESNYQSNYYYIYENNRYSLCEDADYDKEKIYYLYDVESVINAQGTIKVNVSTPDNEIRNVDIGGIVATNYCQLFGSFVEEGPMVPVFNDAGFDSSLNIVAAIAKDKTNTAITNIGGAVGRNIGTVANISIQGSVSAADLNNVGGLVGTAAYDAVYNSEDYSIKNSYSIAKIEGNDNVGGAIGNATGTSEEDCVKFYNISAENYATVFNKNKTFVIGKNNVGGVVGYSNFAEFEYCYSISYFEDGILDQEDFVGSLVTTNFDIIGNNKVGGFVGSSNNTNYSSVSSGLYVLGYVGNTGIFAGENNSSTASNIFATGSVHLTENTLVHGLGVNASNFAYYNYVAYSAVGVPTSITAYLDGEAFVLDSPSVDDIISFFNNKANEYNQDIANGAVNPRNAWVQYWAIDESDKEQKINNGLPYLTIDGRALYATVPLQIISIVNDVPEDVKYTTHIKNDDSSLVLFYNYDYLNAYGEYTDRVQKLNLLSLSQLASLKVFAETYKSYRLDISISGHGVLDILSDGTIKVLGEGSEEIIISSKLNAKYQARIYVVVKYGVNDITLYSNISFTTDLDDCEGENQVETLKSRNYSLYKEQTYTRSITENAEDSFLNNAVLRSTNDYGVRFIVDSADVAEILANTENAKDINDLFKINGLNWLGSSNAQSTIYYVDVPKKVNIFISPITAFDASLKIEYIPYLSETFNSRINTIYLDRFAGDFEFIVKKGATKILIESNKDNLFSLSQLQTQAFTVTMYTDYEDDALVESFSSLVYEEYNPNNIWDVINGSEVDGDASDLLTIVRSDITRNYSDEDKKILESISITYTINYKDKINAVKKDKLFRFYYRAYSDATVDLTVGIIILGQDKINQVYGTVYSGLSDFPQTPDKNNIIYNGTVGVLAVEVYPFFSNYDKLRVRYESALNYPMFMTQLSYNISGNTGDKLVEYPDSGSVSDFDEVLWIEKSSGQDTYLLNDLGLYSYSKTYFISLLVSTLVPDDTIYTIYIDILNYQNDIIDTFTIEVKSVAQPGIKFSFDQRTYGADNKYYLPLNTVNKIDVSTHNYEGEIEWEVSCLDDVLLTDELKNVLTPYLDVDGNYYFKVMEYLGANQNNVFTLDLLGKTLQIKGSIDDGRNSPKYGQNFFTVEVVVSLFTVLDVVVQNVEDGYMTLPVSTTTPLYAYVDAYYDKALTESADNWYVNVEREELEEALRSCGYAIEDSFINYITQLQNALSKARYTQEEEQEVKTSGVWFYSTEDGASSYLQSTKTYNSNSFGVELFNDYFAVYGRQIDINTSLSLRLSLSYTNGLNGDRRVCGIPNVKGYNVSPTNTTYESLFNFRKDFILTFVYKSDLINAIPVSTAEEFLTMKPGFDYRLVNDIELSAYAPISTEISTFDGNNHTIFITSFAYNNEVTDEVLLGLFGTVSENTILYNVKVCYTNKIEYVNEEMQSVANGMLNIGLLKSSSVTFGGIAAVNKGTITNSCVTGSITVILNADVNAGLIGAGYNGGIAAKNDATGYITNSKVVNFSLNCYGSTGGVIQENNGKVVATYLNSSTINNLSSGETGGFVHTNNGEIYECFAQGYRQNTDNDIRNTGLGITSKGIVSGFAYKNANIINDCYSNIKLSSSRYIAGFVHEDTSDSIISRSYSICFKEKNDNSLVASPFFGTNDLTMKITVNGKLINCFFLKGTGTWIDVNEDNYANKEVEKIPVGLSFDEFATHTSFVNFDLSLTYQTSTYADGSSYNYVDGYTWVIIDGKPNLVSTLVETISERSYEGKNKQYSTNYNIFTAPVKTGSYNPVVIDQIKGEFGENKHKYIYYNGYNSDGLAYTNPENAKFPENILYTVEVDFNNKLMTYTFEPRDIANNERSQLLTIVYKIESTGETITSKSVLYADYGDQEKYILDVREETAEGFVDDKNYRANDTIVIKYVSEDSIQISSIDYYVLENASYYYSDAVYGSSYGSGTRSNPQIVYDKESFNYYLATYTRSKFFRLIKDIDFEYGFTKTSYSDFQGALQGNYMVLSRLSISYISNSDGSDDQVGAQNSLNAFGLFAKVSTIERADFTEFSSTIISNLKVEVVEVLSNTHGFVGGLAGHIDAYGDGDMNKNVILNNIRIVGYNDGRAFVQGNNAVGGLAGYATGNVIIKDIYSTVSVNAAKEMDVGFDASTMLYIKNVPANMKNVSYAGGIVGVLDADAIKDSSTLKDYNANNLSVSGDFTIIGGVAGGAFGLTGQTTVVNYANVTVKTSTKNFIKALSYAGGIVGENRGRIVSSSVTYGSLESYSTVQPGESNLINTNFFYNGKVGDSVVAIGGIAGLNNGGTISNTLSTVDVRNVNAIIAGGAVGRMIEGTLENVIASGSVLADSIIGGLIGSLNDREIVLNAGYSENAIVSVTETQATPTILTNNVSANNWLVQDYTTYDMMLKESKIVGGYIGLVAHSTTMTADGQFDFVEFGGKSYYSNTLYTSKTSLQPKSYLKAGYVTNSFDNASLIEQQPINVFVNGEGQAVYPYSTREMYYENKFIGPYYTIKSLINYVPDSNKVEGTTYINFAYEVIDFSGLTNIGDLYSQIDITSWSNREEFIAEDDKKELCNSFKTHFGNVYQIRDGRYELVSEVNNQEGVGRLTGANRYKYNYYYISSDDLTYIKTQVTYSSSEHNIVPFEVSENKNDLKNIKSFVIDGILITLGANAFEETAEPNKYKLKNTVNIELPNGVNIVNVSFEAGVQDRVVEGVRHDYFIIKSVTVDYSYDTTKEFISKKKDPTNDINANQYKLSVSSKEVIYKSFINNGHWIADINFLLDDNYTKATKYLTNLENSEIYIWEEFRTTFDAGIIDHISQNYGSTIEIKSAEEFALFAYYVNNGQTYAGKTVKLASDIDLSGKYWVPIGKSADAVTPTDKPFMGEFDGNGYTIKYATVNEKSNINNTLPLDAGIFGLVKNATIKNLTVSGGDIEGVNAGGVVGCIKTDADKDCVLANIVNRNTVNGMQYAGGIAGLSTKNVSLNNVVNYGQVNLKRSDNREVFVGGIVGKATTAKIGGNPVINYGDIDAVNMKNSYTKADNVLTEKSIVVVGGIVGSLTNIVLNNNSLVNRGNIVVSTNAHYLEIGGILGIYNADYKTFNTGGSSNSLVGLKNYGNIDVSYRNIKIRDTALSASANIAGIVGRTSNNISKCGNEGAISLTVSTTSVAYIGIGGIVGATNGNIDSCYNTNNIDAITISNKTNVAVGGIVGLTNATSGSTGKNHTLSNCYNAGDIYCDGNATMYVGGIFGSSYIYDAEGKFTIYDQSAGFKGITSYRNTIKCCLNIGYVNFTLFREAHNALGAIAGIDTFLIQSNNRYLVDSAYSGSEIFTSVCSAIDEDSGFVKFSAVPDVDTQNEGFIGALGKKSTTLKPTEDFNDYNDLNNGSIASDSFWTFSGASQVWVQNYETWYPTLANNKSSSLWIDKQEVVSQEKGSYVIRTAEQLAYMADKINNGELDSNNITIKLANSIDLANRYWTPIGTSQYPFKGTFDGGNYVIRNLTIDGAVIDYEYLKIYNYGALFGYVVDGKILNVGLESTIIQNVKVAATIACYADNSRIEKVYSDLGESEAALISVDIDNKYIEGGSVVLPQTVGAAGLVYSMVNCIPLEQNNMTGGLYYSYNNIPVRLEASVGEYNAISYIGGLVGSLENSLIDNSYNNSNGKVYLEADNIEELTGYLISGYADKYSALFNVFNLASINQIAATGKSVDVKNLFKIEQNENNIKANVISTNNPPLFENLDNTGEVDIKKIWTNEYSLNTEENSAFPFLRSLGKEWKNTESEGLKSYTFTNNDTSTLEVQLLENVLSGEPTLFKVQNPEVGYVQSHTEKVYLISTAEELAWLATNVNNGSLVTTNCEFVLIKDIDLTGRYWTPIGTTTVYPFQGVFNFNGHVISGLTIDSNSLLYGGLFGYTSNAYICNGYIKNAFIKVANESPTTNIYVGTVVGKGYNTTITNMTVTTNLIAYSNAAAFVGGIIGSLTGTNDYIISNVIVNTATKVNSAGAEIEVTDKFVDVSMYRTYIEELSNPAYLNANNVSIGAFSTGGNVYCGGVAGYMSGYHVTEVNSEYLLNSATNNVNIAAVSISNSADVFLGGILGHGLEEVTLNVVKNTGHLKSFSNQSDVIGGIVGYLYNGGVSNAQFTGNIEGTQDAAHIRTYLGGIVGTLETAGSVKNCVNSGTINLNADYKEMATIGGIIGQTIDHLFTSDEMSAYNYSELGFADAVGLAEYRDGFAVEDKEKDYSTVFLPAVSNFKVEGSSVWNIAVGSEPKLEVSHIHLNGCQTSFYDEAGNGLSATGSLTNKLNILLNYTGVYVDTYKIAFGIVDRNLNYFKMEATLNGGSNVFNLQQYLQDAIANYKTANPHTNLDMYDKNGNIDISYLSNIFVTLVIPETGV